MSGNETILERVFFSSPKKFIEAAYTNTDKDILKEFGKTPEFQLTRLEETKATVARSIFNCHKIVGDDDTFYSSFSVYSQQYIRSTRVAARYDMSNSHGADRIWAACRWASAASEGILNKVFGHATNWGSSASRPLFLLVSTFITFFLVYYMFLLDGFFSSLQMAFDVTSIAGFTRSVTVSVSPTL